MSSCALMTKTCDGLIFLAYQQLNFSEFPFGCVSYNAPHTKKCLESIWEINGCLKNGEGWPGNISDRQVATYNLFNIR